MNLHGNIYFIISLEAVLLTNSDSSDFRIFIILSLSSLEVRAQVVHRWFIKYVNFCLNFKTAILEMKISSGCRYAAYCCNLHLAL